MMSCRHYIAPRVVIVRRRRHPTSCPMRQSWGNHDAKRLNVCADERRASASRAFVGSVSAAVESAARGARNAAQGLRLFRAMRRFTRDSSLASTTQPRHVAAPQRHGIAESAGHP